MKMMLKLMLTPEQYSAMQLCGSSVQLQDDDGDDKDDKPKKGNHKVQPAAEEAKLK